MKVKLRIQKEGAAFMRLPTRFSMRTASERPAPTSQLRERRLARGAALALFSMSWTTACWKNCTGRTSDFRNHDE